MILIIGSQHDDILYFESVMSNKKTEIVLGKYQVTIGTIFNQGVVLVDEVKTNYVSSALVLHLIEKYFVFLIFNVGRCVAFTHDIKPMDIVISKRVIAGDVDQVDEDNVKFGQIPGFEQVFISQDDIIGYLRDAFEKRTYSNVKIGNYVSTSVDYHRVEQVNHLKEGEHLLGFSNNIVFDSNSAGIALAAELKKVAFVSAKVVERYIDSKKDIHTYLKALKEYTNIGKAVVTCIGDISRNEVITEGGGK